MNKRLILMGCISVFFFAISTANAKSNPVKKVDDNLYRQNIGPIFYYYVETSAQLCFAIITGGIAEIDCEKLAKLPEWAPIITWVKQ